MPVPALDLTPDTLDLIPDDARGLPDRGLLGGGGEGPRPRRGRVPRRRLPYRGVPARGARRQHGRLPRRGYTALECKRAGYSCWECAWAGYSASEICAAGYSSSSCRETGVITSAAGRAALASTPRPRAPRASRPPSARRPSTRRSSACSPASARALWPLCGPDLCAEIVRFYNMGERVLCEGKSAPVAPRRRRLARADPVRGRRVNTDNARRRPSPCPSTAALRSVVADPGAFRGGRDGGDALDSERETPAGGGGRATRSPCHAGGPARPGLPRDDCDSAAAAVVVVVATDARPADSPPRVSFFCAVLPIELSTSRIGVAMVVDLAIFARDEFVFVITD